MHPPRYDFYFNLEISRELDPEDKKSVRDKLSNICVAIVCCIVFRREPYQWLIRCKSLGTRMGKILGRHQARTRLTGWNWRNLIKVLEEHNDTMTNYGEDLFTILLDCRQASKNLVKIFLRWAKEEFDTVIDEDEERRLHITLRDLDLDSDEGQ
jgi:hypothetical protein